MAYSEDNYKTVSLPLKVPAGEYCWDHAGTGTICEHFDNAGGHPKCLLKIGYEVKGTFNGVEKPEKCLSLVDIIERKETK